MRESALELARRLDERQRVILMLLYPCAYGEYVGVEDYVLRRESDRFGEDAICALADGDFALGGVRLPVFVERHDDDRRPVPPRDSGLANELAFALFQR